MYAVAADFGSGFYQGNHFAASLHQLIGNDKSYITGSQHNDFLTGLYSVYVDHGLSSAGAHNARCCPSLESYNVFLSACGQDDLFRLHVNDFCAAVGLTLFQAGDFIIKKTYASRIQPNVNT